MFDITDPHDITLAGIHEDNNFGDIYDIEIFGSGSRTYAAGMVDIHESGFGTVDRFQIFDITDPHDITLAGILEDSDAFRNFGSMEIFGSGSNTYAAALRYDHIIILDLTNPAYPEITASLTVTDDSDSIAISQLGGSFYALVANSIDQEIQIIDVTDPTDLVRVASVTHNTNDESLFSNAGPQNDMHPGLAHNENVHVYVATGGFGTLGQPYSITTFQIGQNYYAMTGGHLGIQVIDISNIKNPILPSTPPSQAGSGLSDVVDDINDLIGSAGSEADVPQESNDATTSDDLGNLIREELAEVDVDQMQQELTELDPSEDIEQNTGGCLIATAAYGSELAPQVQFLREIRDSTLLSTSSGASFMAGFNQVYYSFSPAIADLERENPVFRDMVRGVITPAMYAMNVMTLADPGSEASVLAFGILSIGIIGGMYVAGPYLTIRAVSRRAIQHRNNNC